MTYIFTANWEPGLNIYTNQEFGYFDCTSHNKFAYENAMVENDIKLMRNA